MPDVGWVRMYHPDTVEKQPDPDDPSDSNKFSLVTEQAYRAVWERRGWKLLDDDAKATSTEEQTPDTAARRRGSSTVKNEEA